MRQNYMYSAKSKYYRALIIIFMRIDLLRICCSLCFRRIDMINIDITYTIMPENLRSIILNLSIRALIYQNKKQYLAT